MKAEELMIGDYVFVGDDKTPIKITHISKSGDYSYLKPIPLTVEILEKNGFVKHLPEDNIVYFTITINKKEIRIDYVHQLQHALRLCGIEKEIKL